MVLVLAAIVEIEAGDPDGLFIAMTMG